NVHANDGTLELLFELAGIRSVTFELSGTPTIWAPWDSARQRQIARVLTTLHTYVAREQVLPVEEFDLLVHVNKQVGKAHPLSLVELQALLGYCDFIERTSDGRIQAQFHHLHGRGNQSYRLLSTAEAAISLRELARTINARCVPFGVEKVSIRNLAN